MSETEIATDVVKDPLEGKSVSELIEIIHETRSEAKARRTREKELSDRLSSYEAKQNELEQSKKIAEGKKDEVISDLTKQLESVTKDAEQWKKYFGTKKTKIKESLKENWLDSFDLLPLEDLEALELKFNNSSTLLETDGGKKKIAQVGRLEGLTKDLEIAIAKKDLSAQLAIKRMIAEEQKKK